MHAGAIIVGSVVDTLLYRFVYEWNSLGHRVFITLDISSEDGVNNYVGGIMTDDCCPTFTITLKKCYLTMALSLRPFPSPYFSKYRYYELSAHSITSS
jgi:hypothetical protein